MGRDPSEAPAGYKPSLRTSRILLRPATRADGATLYGLLLGLGLNTLPTLDQWLDGGLAGQGAAAQFVVSRISDDTIVGFTALYELDINAGHVKAGVYTNAGGSGLGVGAEACILTVNYAFAMWNLRKVYFHTTEASLPDFGGSLDRVARQEAVLPEYQFFRGRLWDVYIYAIHRRDWDEVGVGIAERITRSNASEMMGSGQGNGRHVG